MNIGTKVALSYIRREDNEISYQLFPGVITITFVSLLLVYNNEQTLPILYSVSIRNCIQWLPRDIFILHVLKVSYFDLSLCIPKFKLL